MLLDDLLEPAGKAFIGFGLRLKNLAGKDHVALVRFHHVGHPLVRRRANRRHRGLRLLVGLDPDLVDPVRDVLLLRGLERFRECIIKHHALFRVGLELVDQNHLRRRLVLQTVDPGLALLDIALKRLALGKLDLLLLHHFVIGLVEVGQFSLKLSARRRVLLDRDLVLQRDDLRVHRQDLRPQALQFAHGHFPLIQRFGEVGFNLRLLFIQDRQLPLEQLGDHVRLGD